MRQLFAAACAASLLAACAGMDGGMKDAGMHQGMAGDAGMGPHETTAMMPMVGGAPMLPTRDIVDNAVNSRDHTTLVAAVKAAGLVDTLKGPGPLTVFAPTNTAFGMLPAGTVDTLLKPQNRAALTRVLTYHVVPGRLDAAALAAQIRAGGGKAMLKTAAGGMLTATMRGKDVVIEDAQGGMATLTTSDVYQSNGVIHVVDHVLWPG